jgi:hypothetical protein
MATIINASTSSGLVQTADTSGELALQSNGTTQLTMSSTGAYGTVKSGTAVATTSGTSVELITSIPSWVKRVTVVFNGVSTNGTSAASSGIVLQLSTSGGYVTSGYGGNAIHVGATGLGSTNYTNGLALIDEVTAAYAYSGIATLCLSSSNTWSMASTIASASSSATNGTGIGAGVIALGGALTAIRITTSGGVNTFDAGSINILYEG